MEPIVEITEYPDYEAYRRFYYFLNVRNPAAWFNWIITYALMPLVTVHILYADLLNHWRYGQVGINTLWVPAATIALIIYQATKPHRAYKRRGPGFVTARTAFFEDYYAYVNTGQNSMNEGSRNYVDIEKAYETTDAFYIKYVGKGWGFFPKKFFAPGQVEALRDLFVRKFGGKFISKI